MDIAAPVHDLERERGGSAAILVARVRGVDDEAGESGGGELRSDRLAQALGIERGADLRDVHGVVWMQPAPAQHRDLEQVEAAFHDAGRAARTARCASSHQCRLTLYQMSAACVRFDVSMPLGRRERRRRIVGVDPRARDRVGGEMRGERQSDVAVRRRQRDVAHARGARSRDNGSSSQRPPASGSPGIQKPVNSSTLSGILRSRGSIAHCPSRTRIVLPVASAAAYGSFRPTTGRVCAGQRIADRRARKRLAGGGIATRRSPRRTRRQARAARGWRSCRPGCVRSASASCRRARSARRSRRPARRCRR